jgi:segregation and condensation protein A
MTFIVKQEHFEGPLDLLLTLIEKHKLFVNDIALAKVTDDFIEHIRTFENFPLADSANFILIASTLLLIKSKSLLPALDLTGEEEQSMHDLETRLKIYQEIKQASLGVKALFGKEIIFQPSQSGLRLRSSVPVFSPDSSMTISAIAAAIGNLIRALPKKELLPKALVQKVISLEEMITRLTERVTKNLSMSFREFAKANGNSNGSGNSIGGTTSDEKTREYKVNIIISFLAMLELVKQGVIHVTQERPGDDINMETQTACVPQYM